MTAIKVQVGVQQRDSSHFSPCRLLEVDCLELRSIGCVQLPVCISLEKCRWQGCFKQKHYSAGPLRNQNQGEGGFTRDPDLQPSLNIRKCSAAVDLQLIQLSCTHNRLLMLMLHVVQIEYFFSYWFGVIEDDAVFISRCKQTLSLRDFVCPWLYSITVLYNMPLQRP